MPFNIDDFRSHVSNNSEFAYTDKFEVMFSPPAGITKDVKPLTFQCEIAELPGKNINMVEYRHYGFTKRIPHHISFSEINVTFFCNGDMTEKKLFDAWQDSMISTKTGLVEYYSGNYWSNITISQYSHIGSPNGPITVPGYQQNLTNRNLIQEGSEVNSGENVHSRMQSDRPTNAELPLYNPRKIYECTLIEAVPVAVSSLPLNWADNSIHKLNVTFAYKKWISGAFQDAANPDITPIAANYDAEGRIDIGPDGYYNDRRVEGINNGTSRSLNETTFNPRNTKSFFKRVKNNI